MAALSEVVLELGLCVLEELIDDTMKVWDLTAVEQALYEHSVALS